MKRLIAHWFLSHKKNGYAPRLLAETGVAVLFVLIIIFFGTFSLEKALISTNQQLGAVYVSALEVLANEDRATENLPALTINPLLENAAAAKAADMAAKGYFAHYAPDGTSPWYWISKAGYDFSYAGENLAIDYDDSTSVNSAWLASPEHRANIMNINYTDIGIATAEENYNGKVGTVVVEMFGTPAEGSSKPGAGSPIEPAVAAIQGTATTAPTVPIAVRNINAEPAVPSKASTNVLGASVAPSPLSVPATSPNHVLAFIYLLIGIIVVATIAGIVGAGIRRHNIIQIGYGLGLIAVMIGLFFVGTHFGGLIL